MEILNLGGMKTGPDGYLRYEVVAKPAPKVELRLYFGVTVVAVVCERKVDAGRKLEEFRSKGHMTNLANGEILLASNMTKAEIVVINGEL